MIGSQPAIRAAINPANPTVPVPKTAKASPGCGRRTFKTAPAPVLMPQGKAASNSSGTSSGTLTTLRSVASAKVANDDCWKKQLNTGAPLQGHHG